MKYEQLLKLFQTRDDKLFCKIRKIILDGSQMEAFIYEHYYSNQHGDNVIKLLDNSGLIAEDSQQVQNHKNMKFFDYKETQRQKEISDKCLNDYFNECINNQLLFTDQTINTKESYQRTLRGRYQYIFRCGKDQLDYEIILNYIKRNPTNQVLSVGQKLLKLIGAQINDELKQSITQSGVLKQYYSQCSDYQLMLYIQQLLYDLDKKRNIKKLLFVFFLVNIKIDFEGHLITFNKQGFLICELKNQIFKENKNLETLLIEPKFNSQLFERDLKKSHKRLLIKINFIIIIQKKYLQKIFLKQLNDDFLGS